jgi:surface carbohydrate biosynthesis protein
MKKKLTICFPIEIKKREFLPKLYLAYQLLKTKKVNIVIGDKKFFFIDYEKSKNLIFFFKGGGEHLSNLFKHVSKNNFIFNLDEEGPIFLLRKYDIDLKVNKKVNQYMSKIILWGTEDRKIYKLRDCDSSKVKVLGHPKLDLLKKPFIGIFKKEYNLIRNKFRNFVFIPSHYSVDNIIKDSNYFLYIKKTRKIKSDSKQKATKELKRYTQFINLVKFLAEKNPDKLFIFRPHPGQSLSKVKLRFGKIPGNLKIIFNYTVTPWILACEHYIHSGCTTVFEAAVLNKKITYISNFDKFDYLWSKIGNKFKVHDTKKILRSLINDNNILKTNKFFKAENFVHNITKKNNFTKKFIEMLKAENYLDKISSLHIRKYNLNRQRFYKIIFSQIKDVFLKIDLIAKIFSYFNPSSVFTKEMKNSKFDKIGKKEINKNLKLLSTLDKVNIKFKVSDLNGHMFQINLM